MLAQPAIPTSHEWIFKNPLNGGYVQTAAIYPKTFEKNSVIQMVDIYLILLHLVLLSWECLSLIGTIWRKCQIKIIKVVIGEQGIQSVTRHALPWTPLRYLLEEQQMPGNRLSPWPLALSIEKLSLAGDLKKQEQFPKKEKTFRTKQLHFNGQS